MKCKFCFRLIPDDAVFCCYCGERVPRKKKAPRQEIKVPAPRQLKSGAWNIELRKEGSSITEATAEACLAKARAIRAGFLKTEKALPKQSLDSVVEKYIVDNTGVLSPSTVRGYESIRKTRFQSAMQEDVNGIDWQALVSAEAQTVSPKTVVNAWRLITGALKHAGLPVPEVNLPKRVKSDRPWLDYSQILVFLEAIKGRKCERACLLALHSLRMSEIMALTPESVQNGRILVSGAIVIDSAGEYVRKDTGKTAASRREIPVMIPRLLEIWPEEGEPLQWQKHAAINEMVQAICKEAGLPEITMHGLRHSFASLAWYLGWDIMTTCYYGGWSDTSTVQRIYTHLSKQVKDRDVQNMEAFYNSQITNGNTNETSKASN